MKLYGKVWIMVLALAIAALAAYANLNTPPALAAGPWYVGPGGDDTDACTSQPTRCATINGALNKPGFVAGDTILVQVGTYTGSGDEVVLLNKSATLSGGWNSGFTTQNGMSTIVGQDSRRGITVNNGVTAIVEYFAVQRGSASDGGGVFNEGTLTLNTSTVSASTSLSGGGIYSGGTLTLNNSTVSDNTSFYGGGISGGTLLTLNNSTVTNNIASRDGGGVFFTGTLTLNNSTVSDNTSSYSGGGIFNSNIGTLTLNNSTVSDNTSMYGGGIHINGTLTLQNSIIAGNIGTYGPDCNGSIGSLGYNLIGNMSGCTFTPTTGDLTNVDPKLGPLEGSPGYHPLLIGSPAIDAGNPAGCTDHLGNPLNTDQRGVARVGRCDIGAYEFDGVIFYTFLPIISGCQRLYFDDFSNPASGWSIGDNGNIRREYLNGEYRVLVRQPGWVALSRPFSNNSPDFRGDNYVVAVDARNPTGIPGSHSLIYEISDNFAQFYTFDIFPDGSYEIWRVNFNGSSVILRSGSSGSINTGTASNRLKVERNGSLIRAYANGQLVTTVSDGTYTGQRQVGVAVRSLNQTNMDALFDNFTVYPVSCGVAATALNQASEPPEPGEGAAEIELSGGWGSGQDQR